MFLVDSVRDGAEFKNKFMAVMVYFQPAEKINKLVAHPVHNYCILLTSKRQQYHEFTVSHPYLLEQLSPAASHECVHLSLILG
jgi:hypothetical protein